MNLRLVTLSLAVALAGTANIATAGSDSGFYLGGSVGTAQIDYSEDDPDLGEVEFDDDDAAYKVFAGYNFGVVPFMNLAVEAAYLDFGSYDGDIGVINSNIDVDSWTAFAVAGFDLGPIGVFGKAGMLNWDAELKTPIGSVSDSGTDPAYGIGAKIQLGSFAIRAEYEMFDLEEFDVDYFSVGGSITF